MRRHLLVSIIIFILGGLILTKVVRTPLSWRIGKGNPRTFKQTEGSTYQNPPVIKGVSYTAYQAQQKLFSLKADKVFCRSQRLGGITFGAFKEIVISNARVEVYTQVVEDILSWVKRQNMSLLLSSILSDNSFTKLHPVSRAGIRIVLENLKVYARSNTKETPWIIISADTAIKGAFSDGIIFKGNFCLNFATGEPLTGTEANWLSPRTFYFPSGYLLGNRRCSKGFFVLNRAGTPAYIGEHPPVDVTFDEAKLPATSNTTAQSNKQTQFNTPNVAFDMVDLAKIRKSLRKRDYKAIKALLWQLLMLNPNIFKELKLSPLIMLAPSLNFSVPQHEVLASSLKHIPQHE
jgi:hypothetical protein